MRNFCSVFLILVAILEVSSACRCIPPTQNMTYCRAQWISKAKILKKVNENGLIHYNVQHLKVFKNSTKELPTDVYTASQSAACGVTSLRENQEYLLVGTVDSGKLQITSCLFMPPKDGQGGQHPLWKDVPQDLRLRLVKKDFKPCPILEI